MNQEEAEPTQVLQDEYDFSGAVRGRHHAAYAQGTNIVFLDGDVAEVFKDSAAVNQALRMLLRLAEAQAHIPHSV